MSYGSHEPPPAEPPAPLPPAAIPLPAPPVLSYPSANVQLVKPQFRIGWVGLIPIAIFLAVEAIYQWPLASRRALDPGGVVPYAAGRLLAGIGLPLLVAWVIWRIARRPRYLATALFCAVTLMFAAAQYFDARVFVQKAAAAVLNHEFLSMREATRTTGHAVQSFNATHTRAPELKDPAVLQQRLDVVQAAVDRIQDELNQGDGVSAKLSSRLTDAALTPAERDAVIQGFMARVAWSKGRQSLVDMKEFYGTVQNIFLFFKAHPSEWSGDGAIGDVKWQTLDEATAFLKLRNAMVEATAKLKTHLAATTPSALQK